MTTLQVNPYRAVAALAASLVLAACASAPAPTPSSTASSSQNPIGTDSAPPPAAAAAGQRDLTPAEKKIMVDAIAPSIKDPASAKYRWAKFPNTADGSVTYCGMVTAKSPYPAYNGLQAYILEATVKGGKVSAAVVGLITGGKDIELVRKMCEKSALDPNNAT